MPVACLASRLKLIFGRPERRQMAQKVKQAFAVLPETPAKAFAPGGVGIKPLDVFIVELIEFFF